ncbi:reverse transcriptase family protein [Aspergillus affinis]|uniref:reverse transcriptase family protein n=1 Tax=Aspergillus affinis TaxID=1070780 RepID=UPI0022FF1F32|nr:uncharacterized protein KD926_001257 [Aspergillus affinis]KAI9036869.1 hypothetical protein KD926_001257 [Aspergillus affinis]
MGVQPYFTTDLNDDGPIPPIKRASKIVRRIFVEENLTNVLPAKIDAAFELVINYFSSSNISVTEIQYWNNFFIIVLDNEDVNMAEVPSAIGRSQRICDPTEGVVDNSKYEILRPGVMLSSDKHPVNGMELRSSTHPQEARILARLSWKSYTLSNYEASEQTPSWMSYYERRRHGNQGSSSLKLPLSDASSHGKLCHAFVQRNPVPAYKTRRALTEGISPTWARTPGPKRKRNTADPAVQHRKGLQWQLLYLKQQIVSIYISTRGPAGNWPGHGPTDLLVFIHNVYNHPGPSNAGIHELREAFQAAESTLRPLEATAAAGGHHHVVIGDFNLHDQEWSGPTHPRPHLNRAKVNEFKELMEEIPLAILTPPGSSPGLPGHPLRLCEHSKPGFTPEARETQRLSNQLKREILGLQRSCHPVPEDLYMRRLQALRAGKKAMKRIRATTYRKHVESISGSQDKLWRLHFREARTIALRKPGKPDYPIPKAYRPIALLNTLGKALESVLATRLSYLAETYNLLPINHLGGRGTEAALHTVVKVIQSAWKQGKMVSILYLDISGAFDNVSHPRLLHNLRKRGVPLEIVNWIASFLSNRYTTLVLPEYTSPRAPVNTGIPQGSPLSPILYIFYKVDMMVGKHTVNISYIDDTTIIAIGDSEAENCATLEREFRVTSVPWSETHASVFAPDKFQVVHHHCPVRPRTTKRRRSLASTPAPIPAARRPNRSTRPRTAPREVQSDDEEADPDWASQSSSSWSSAASSGPRRPEYPVPPPKLETPTSLDLGNGQVVKASRSAKLLGVQLDENLTFGSHIEQVEARPSKALQAINALGGSNWGISTKER